MPENVHRIVSLPLGKSVQIAFQSIRVRFFRSLVTTMSLVLAVAFLCFIFSGNDLAESLLQSGSTNITRQLQDAGYDILPGQTELDASTKQRWIVFLSLLVCVVGIVNAQLMSVTERFREIGTLKCLGALDSIIVRLFVLEATMQGVVGSLTGAVLGVLAAIVNSLLRFGFAVFSHFPVTDLLVSMGIALVTGTGLSLLGVLYPALLAAKMQPVEAMRVEQ